MTKVRKPLIPLLAEYPFGILLAALLLIIVAAPLTGRISHVSFMHGQAAMAPYVFILTVASAYALWSTPRHRTATLIMGGFVLLLLYLSTTFPHHRLAAVHLTAQAAFMVFVIAAVLRRVFSAPEVDGNILCGAASLYLLIGVLMGFLFSIIEIVVPGSFAIVPAGETSPPPTVRPGPGWLIYYSFTTLTTVGFGDVMPSGDLARSASVFEAVVGQMLLVVMMARLVGLHVAQSSTRSHRPVIFETSEPARRKP
jgi:Ion channel.